MIPFLNETAEKIQEILENGYKKNDVTGEARKAISQVGASAFHLVSVFAIAVLAIAFVLAAIKLSGDPRSRSEGKDKMVRILVAGAAVFGVLAIIDLIAYIVQSSISK